MTPFWDIVEPASYVGGLLVWAGILEILHGFKRAENKARYSAWFSGGITLLIGTLMINAILFQPKALVDFIIFLFCLMGLDMSIYIVKLKKSAAGVICIYYLPD